MIDGSGEAHLLDNPVWHALRGNLARFSSPGSTAELVHFDPEVSVFSAVDRIDAPTWLRVSESIGLEGLCGFFRDVVPPPPSGWEELYRGPCWQMVAGEFTPISGHKIESLGEEDRDAMLALAKLTEPGPFQLRTPELGRYVGVRRDGQLLAMAGERFRLPGYVEISAVCTHPDARGRGLAAELTLNVAQAIREQGNEAFLHVLVENENAFRLYQKLGFIVRRKVDVVFVQWHGPDWQPPPTSMP